MQRPYVYSKLNPVQTNHLTWLNTVLQAASSNSSDGTCFNLDKQTWQRKSKGTVQKTIIFSKSTH